MSETNELSGQALYQAVVRVRWPHSEAMLTMNTGESFIWDEAGFHAVTPPYATELLAWRDAAEKEIAALYNIACITDGWVWYHKQDSTNTRGFFASRDLAFNAACRDYVSEAVRQAPREAKQIGYDLGCEQCGPSICLHVPPTPQPVESDTMQRFPSAWQVSPQPVESAREMALHEAAGALCGLCRQGHEPRFAGSSTKNLWTHAPDGQDVWTGNYTCKAPEIRRLLTLPEPFLTFTQTDARVAELDREREQIAKLALLSLSGAGVCTPEETYGTDALWAVRDMARGIRNLQGRVLAAEARSAELQRELTEERAANNAQALIAANALRDAEAAEQKNERLREALLSVKKKWQHNSPSDCYSTGPSSGNLINDHVSCPGCFVQSIVDKALAHPGEHAAEGGQG